MRGSREGMTTTSVLIVVVILIVVVSALVIVFLLPIKPVNIELTRNVPAHIGVEDIELSVDGDVGSIEVSFADMAETLVDVNVRVTGAINIFDDIADYNLSFEYLISEGTLTVLVVLDPDEAFGWINFLNVDCKVTVSEALRANLDLSTHTGSVSLITTENVSIAGADLTTNTGSVEARLVPGTVVSGDLSFTTNTGSVTLRIENVYLTENVTVELTTNTGGVDLIFEQTQPMGHSIEVMGTTQTGGIEANVILKGDTSAIIEWSVVTGSTDINRQIGFDRTGDVLQSNNYPASENLGMTLATTTGGMRIWAEWTPI